MRAAASAFAVSITRPPPSATISVAGLDDVEQRGRELVDAPGRDLVHDARALADGRAIADARGVVSSV